MTQDQRERGPEDGRRVGGVDAVLVGLALPGVENHGIGALRAALREAGRTEHFVPFGGFATLMQTLREVLAASPRVVGLSLQTIESALAIVSLSGMLRKRGYAGRIVIGGHFATLNAEELLRADTGLDAVVRFAGEQALLAIVDGALDDEPRAALVPGLVFRGQSGEIRIGAPAQLTSPSVLAGASRSEALPRHLGFVAADLVSSRGCEARCAYCCIAAASELARAEARRGGDAGGGYERRSAAALADEIAALHHEHGARVFNFMDDNVLPAAPADAVEFARAVRGRLDVLGVGPIALSLQLRSDVVTEESAQALAALGLVRAYVGIDGYSSSQLRALGRRADAAAGARALRLLSEQGVFAVANALLVGPTIAFESVLNEIEGLSRIEHAPVHLLPIEVRAGTAYFRAAERRGLVEGGFLHYHYRFADERTALMAQILTAFPTRLDERSVPIALYDLGYNLGIARRLSAGKGLARHAATYRRVAAAWNADQLRVLRVAAAAAGTRSGAAARAVVTAELERTSAHDRALLAECDAAIADVERAVSRQGKRPVLAHSRGKLLGAVAVSMSLAACGGSTTDTGNGDPRTKGDGAVTSSGGVATGGSGGLPGTGGTAGAGGTAGSTGSGGAAGLGGTAGIGGGGISVDASVEAGVVACADPARAPVPYPGTIEPLSVRDRCYVGVYRVRFDAEGRAVEFSSNDGGALPEDLASCLTAYFARYCYPSLAGATHEFRSHSWIA
jgi:anaerobic magnesium-protoporphyrin IX monomethyl ester cyclase